MAKKKAKQEYDAILLSALACGATLETAAAKAGISVRTAIRRKADPEFIVQLRAIRADMIQRAAGVLTAATLESVKTLLSLQQTTIPAAVRLGAARAVIEIGVRLREVSDLEERLAALETQVLAGES